MSFSASLSNYFLFSFWSGHRSGYRSKNIFIVHALTPHFIHSINFYNYFVTKRSPNNAPYRKFSLNCKQHSRNEPIFWKIQKQREQHTKGVLGKVFLNENMQQVYMETPMQKCNFNRVTKQLHWNHTSPRVLSCKFDSYFQNTFS